MFKIFLYRFKIIVKSKEIMFWSLFFPIILVSLFSLAFSNFGEHNIINDSIKVGIVGNDKAHVVEIMEEVKYNDLNLFEAQKVSNKEGQVLLEDNEIMGLLHIDKDETFTLEVNNSNIEATILYEFLNNYQQQMILLQEQVTNNPELLVNGWLEKVTNFENHVEQLYISERSNDLIIISYYSAIAMACLFGAHLSFEGIRSLYPTLSKEGARVTVSPYPKSKLILTDFCVCTLIVLFNQTILILYLDFVLGISFSDQIGSIAIIIALGSIFATAFGYVISLLAKSETYIAPITMLWSFLAGMMIPEIKIIIETALPIAKYLNPVALITDSFYTMFYFDDFSMIIPYLLALLVWTVACLSFAIIYLRRERYDSI